MFAILQQVFYQPLTGNELNWKKLRVSSLFISTFLSFWFIAGGIKFNELLGYGPVDNISVQLFLLVTLFLALVQYLVWSVVAQMIGLVIVTFAKITRRSWKNSFSAIVYFCFLHIMALPFFFAIYVYTETFVTIVLYTLNFSLGQLSFELFNRILIPGLLFYWGFGGIFFRIQQANNFFKSTTLVDASNFQTQVPVIAKSKDQHTNVLLVYGLPIFFFVTSILFYIIPAYIRYGNF